MPTSYQTSAVPRGRRTKEDASKRTRSRGPSEASQQLSNQLFKSYEDGFQSERTKLASRAATVSSSAIPANSPSQQRDAEPAIHVMAYLSPQRSMPELAKDNQKTATSQRTAPKQGVSESSLKCPTPVVDASRPPTDKEVTAKMVMSEEEVKASPSCETPSSSATAAKDNPSSTMHPSVESVPDDTTPVPTSSKSLQHGATRARDAPLTGPNTSPDATASEPATTSESQQILSESPSPESIKGPEFAVPMSSPLHSPRATTYAGFGEYGGYGAPPIAQYPYAYPSHMPMMSGNPSYIYNPYSPPPFFHPPEHQHSFDINSDNQSSRSGGESERDQLLQKISAVLPDIHRLLSEEKATKDVSAFSALTGPQANTGSSEQVSRLQVELDATKKEYEKVIQTLVDERVGLERELGTLRQSVHDLKTVAEELRLTREKLSLSEIAKTEIVTSIDKIKLSKEHLLSSKITQEKDMERLRAELDRKENIHQQSILDVKAQHRDQLAARDKEHHTIMSDQKAILSKIEIELATLISKHANQRKELELSRDAQAEQQTQLDNKSKELAERLSIHANEISTLDKSHKDDLNRLQTELDNQKLRGAQDLAEYQKAASAQMDALNAELENERRTRQRQTEELEGLRARVVVERQRTSDFRTTFTSWKSRFDDLTKESGALHEMAHGLGNNEQTTNQGTEAVQSTIQESQAMS